MNPLPDSPLLLGYLLLFLTATLACLGGVRQAFEVQDASVRRGLIGFLVAGAGWAVLTVGSLLVSVADLSPDLQVSLHSAGLIAGVAAVCAWLSFCLAYSGIPFLQTRGVWRGLLITFAVTALTVLTNPWHELYYTTAPLTEPFPHLGFAYHPPFWIGLGIGYALVAIGCLVLLNPRSRPLGPAAGLPPALFGLIGLPALLDAAGSATSLLLEIRHGPLGVAAFALGGLLIDSSWLKNAPATNQSVSSEARGQAGEDGRAAETTQTNRSANEEHTNSRETRPPIGTEQQRRTFEAARLRGVAASAPGIEFQYYVDPEGDGRYRFVDERAEHILGLSPQPDDFEERFLQRVPEEYRDRHEACVRTARSGGVPEQIELPFDRPDGTRIWLLLTSVLERRSVPGNGETLVFSGLMLDITERKQRKRKLRLLSETVRQTTDGILITEAPNLDAGEAPGSGAIIYANRAFEEITGYSEDELLGRTARVLHGPETDPEVIASLRRAMDAKKPWEGETVNYRKDGTPFISRWTATPIFDEDGSLEYWVSIQRDITEKREREEELRHQRDLLEQTQQVAGAWEIDLRSGEVSASEKVYEIHELDPETEIGGEDILEFYPPEVRRTVREAFERCAEDGEPYDLRVPFVTAQGSRRWVRTVGAPSETEDGAVAKVAGALQDITEHKRRQDALQQSKSRYQTLIENFPDGGVFLFDEDLTYRLAGGQELSKIGLSVEEVIGSTLHDLFPAETADRQADYYRRALNGEKHVFEERYQGRRYRIRTLPVRDEDGTVVSGMAVSRDITERKRQREALQDRQAKVEALYSATNRLLRASNRKEVVRALIELIRETLGYRGVSVRFATEGRLNVADVAESTFEFMPERPPFDVDGDSAVAEVYRTGETLTIDDVETVEVEDPHDYGDLRAVVVVALGEYGTFAVASPEPGAISEFDTHLIEVLGSYATAVLDRLDRERSLREERDLLNRLLATSPAAIVLLDEDGKFVRANERARDVLGIGQDEITGRSFNDPEWNITTLDGDPILDAERPFAQVIRTEEPVFGHEHTIETPEGNRRIFSVSGAPLPDAKGEIQGALFHLNDVTARKEHKQVLRRRTEKIEALYEATRRLLRAESRDEIASEVHGVLQNVFDYPFRYTGFVDEDMLVPKKTTAEGDANLPVPRPFPVSGSTIGARALEAEEAVVIPDVAALDNDIDYGDMRAAAGVPIGQYGVIIAGKAQTGDFDRLNLRLLELLGGYAALVLERLRREKDLLAAKEGAEAARAEAEKARDDAREAARLKSAFLANMSHEIRTPLTSIIGFAEVLGTEISNLELPNARSLEQHAHLIEQGGKRLLETLEGVLNLSKLEAGQMELDSQPLDLTDQIRRTAEELRPKAEGKEIELQVQAADPPVHARADQGGVQIVVQNLLSNAIKYTGNGGDVYVRIYREEEAAVLEVEDTGIGMEPEMSEELFEPFRQESEGMAREYEGSGVGLAVTRRATEAMDGSVAVDTEKGEGSRFTVRLPRADRTRSDREG